jgi:hypothetical protein
VVDPSLLRDKGPWLETCFSILDEMISRGNLIAGFHKSELQQLDANLKLLPSSPRTDPPTHEPGQTSAPNAINSVNMNAADETMSGGDSIPMGFDYLNEWNSDDGLSGEQLMALADSLDFGQLDWLGSDISSF